MRLASYDNEHCFVAEHSDFFGPARAQNNAVVTHLMPLRRAGKKNDDTFLGVSCRDRRATVAVAMCYDGGGAFVSEGSTRIMTAFAGVFAQRQALLPSVLGPRVASRNFARAWTALTGQPSELRFRLRNFSLRRSPCDTPTQGAMRLPTMAEHALIGEWQQQFLREVGIKEQPAELARVVRDRLRRRLITVWDNNGPVAMASYGESGGPLEVARIIAVYTPLQQRGRHYATSLVSALSGRLLDRGSKTVCLSADQTNEVSNRIYRGIGYRRVSDCYQFDFLPEG